MSVTARMQKRGGTGHSRAERSVGLLKERRCPQTGAGEPGVRSPVQEEERGGTVSWQGFSSFLWLLC